MPDRTSTAAKHLTLLRGENNPTQEALYVGLAFDYGLVPTEIAMYSALPVERVRQILVSR